MSLLAKLLTLIITIAVISGTVLITHAIKNEERGVFDEKVQASKLMAGPIVHSIYKDMLDERADMARYLIAGMIAQGTPCGHRSFEETGWRRPFKTSKRCGKWRWSMTASGPSGPTTIRTKRSMSPRGRRSPL